MLVHKSTYSFLTENIAIVFSYLTNQEPSQGVVLQLNVLVVERDTVQNTVYTAFPVMRIYTRSGKSCETAAK